MSLQRKLNQEGRVVARTMCICERKRLLNDHACKGRLTLDHALEFAGKRIDEPFALVATCAWAHSVDQYQDNGEHAKNTDVINEWIALNRMTETDLENYPIFDYEQRKAYLNSIYGVPNNP